VVEVWGTGVPPVETWTVVSDTRFLYDGWNLVAELEADPPSSIPDLPSSQLELLRSYTWGLDLSGSLTGAGGVGGLLFYRNTENGTPETSAACSDGNGNLTALLDAVTGAVVARYDYDAFGNTLKQTGSRATANPIRFSSKYTDSESGLYYYGYRYYRPSQGRWLSKDPIEEFGGLNLYGFVGNDGVNLVDPLGLMESGDPSMVPTPGGRSLQRLDNCNQIWELVESYGQYFWLRRTTNPDPCCDKRNIWPRPPGGNWPPQAPGDPSPEDNTPEEEGPGNGPTPPSQADDDSLFDWARKLPDKISNKPDLSQMNADEVQGSGPQQTADVLEGTRNAVTIGNGVLATATPGPDEIRLAMSGIKVGSAVNRVARIAKAQSPIWKKLQSAKGGTKTDGERYFQWDHLHGEIEVYDKRGKHIGVMDAVTGQMTKPAVPGRKINL